MLHLIVQAPIERAVLARIDAGDAVVFQQRAIWTVLAGHVLQERLQRLLENNCRLYVLQDDMEVNGIKPEQLIEGIKMIDYQGLVELSVANKVNKTWC